MSTVQSPRIRPKQLVAPSTEGFTTEDARAYFARRLAFETDPSDVYHDLSSGVASFVVVDTRQAEAYRSCHVPGAIHLPSGRIRRETTRHLDPGTLIITYCWGPGCNGAAKAAARLSELGFTVRQMIGGIEYWQREGYPVEGEGAGCPQREGDERKNEVALHVDP